MKRNKRVNRAIQALRAHKSYIGDLDADRWIRARVHDIGQDVGYQYAVNFRVIEIRLRTGNPVLEDFRQRSFVADDHRRSILHVASSAPP